MIVTLLFAGEDVEIQIKTVITFLAIALLSHTIGEGYTVPYKTLLRVNTFGKYQEYLAKTLSKRVFNKYLINVLLVSGKKTLTREWLSQESPTLKTWMDVTMEIYNMEKNYKLEDVLAYWEKCVTYITPHRPDFIFINQFNSVYFV